MRMKYFAIFWIAALAIAAGRGPATAPSTAPSTQPSFQVAKISDREAAVLEAALRNSLRRSEGEGTIFISLGSTRRRWKDPPPRFITRFDDLKLKLRPVSAARHPKPGEMESPTRFRGVEDPATGKRSWIHWAEIKEWVSDTKVRVNVGVWSGPLGGGGSVDDYELRGDKWECTGSEEHWVS
jgi:hypothetical protein